MDSAGEGRPPPAAVPMAAPPRAAKRPRAEGEAAGATEQPSPAAKKVKPASTRQSSRKKMPTDSFQFGEGHALKHAAGEEGLEGYYNGKSAGAKGAARKVRAGSASGSGAPAKSSAVPSAAGAAGPPRTANKTSAPTANKKSAPKQATLHSLMGVAPPAQAARAVAPKPASRAAPGAGRMGKNKRQGVANRDALRSAARLENRHGFQSATHGAACDALGSQAVQDVDGWDAKKEAYCTRLAQNCTDKSLEVLLQQSFGGSLMSWQMLKAAPEAQAMDFILDNLTNRDAFGDEDVSRAVSAQPWSACARVHACAPQHMLSTAVLVH